MVAIETSTLFFFYNNNISSLLLHHHPPKKNVQKYITTTLANKKDVSENSTTQQQQQPPFSTPRISSKILSQSAIAVIGSGFIDAGYSGDWSRIGVISKESEDLLKLAAFVVVPLCIFLIFTLSREKED